jgi:hypothetical protein
MNEQTRQVTPASTREVLGDLLLIVAQVLGVLKQAQLDQSRLESAVLLLGDGRSDEALVILHGLNEAHRGSQEEFAEAWGELKALLHRFAGEPPDA